MGGCLCGKQRELEMVFREFKNDLKMENGFGFTLMSDQHKVCYLPFNVIFTTLKFY